LLGLLNPKRGKRTLSADKALGGKEPNLLIIGCDYDPGFQQIAFVDTETGEVGERRLSHREEAEQFYGRLKERSVRVGMEARGQARCLRVC
jgi:hypothetical protein